MAARRQSCFPFRQSYHGENVSVCPLNHRVNYSFVLLLVACYLTHAVVSTFLDVELFRMFCPDCWYAMLVLTHRWSEAAFFLLFLKITVFFSHFLLHWSTLAEGRDIFLPLVFWSGGEGMCKDRQVFDQKKPVCSRVHLLLSLLPSCLFSPSPPARYFVNLLFWEFKSTSVF